MRGKTKDEWKTILPRLRVDEAKYIEKIIRLTYDDLSARQKDTLHGLVSSINCGRDANNRFTFLESVWDVEDDIQTLADMALISKSGDGEIIVHYLVRYMVSKTGPGLLS